MGGGAVVAYVAAVAIAGAQAPATTTRGEVRRAAVEELRVKFETAKKDAAERMKTARTEFQAKLKQVKDEKKKQAADNLFERLGALNEKWATHFTNVLERYDATLAKVESRRDKAHAAGKDVAAVNAALQEANAAIAGARTAAEVQAKKTYQVTVTTDARLRAAFQASHVALKKDLMDLRDGAMKSAREAVQKAIQALRGIPGVDDDSVRATGTNATSS